MKSLLFQLGAIAILASGQGLISLHAEEGAEGKAAIPSRVDRGDGESEVYRASDVIGLAVKDDGGNEVGKIKDLVINGTSAEVLYAVVAMNEAEEKDVVYVMPWTVFEPSYGQGHAIQYTTLTVPQTVWLRAPYFPMAQWRQTPFTQWGPRVNEYYAGQSQVGARANNRRNTVQVNKPALPDEADEDSTTDKSKAEERKSDIPKSDRNRSDAVRKEAPKPADQGAKRQPADRSPSKGEARNPDQSAAGDKQPAKPNADKLPNPKDVDPPEPKRSPSTPEQPKPKAPNPK